ncbi:flavin reductase family protein [Actinomadura sp. WMMB 499]|uniref:flavin reductase family protein n=1 Tax=Actinomadura sp. WMMB 499 TaxID=1219491 RepID=UPI001C3F79DA|nr:flavin reductase family protein [Actinomadura sp. WMMB 499]
MCLRNSSSTWPRLRRGRRLGVSVLAEQHNDACRALSLRSGDRFAGVDWSACAAGAVFVLGAVAWLECSIEEELPAGDHTIALLAVHALRVDAGRRPLIFHGSRFGRLLAA